MLALPQIMLKVTDDNYDNYKRVFEVLWVFNAKFNKLDPNDANSPLIFLADTEKKSKLLARRSLKSGLTDLIIMSMDLPFDIKKDIGDQLAIHGFSGLNQLISIVRDTLQKVLKRGKIRNHDEYYVLKELLDDSKSNISEAEKRQINALLDSFETYH